MVEKTGGTTDISGQDMHGMAYLMPEFSIEELCYEKKGFERVMTKFKNMRYVDSMYEIVNRTMDAAEIKNPRGRWLSRLAAETPRAFSIIETGQTFQIMKAPGKTEPKSVHDSYNALMEGVRTREIVPAGLYEKIMWTADMVFKLGVGWMTEWIQDHRPDCPTAKKLFQLSKET